MVRYIYGEDPASQNDFFGIVIHELPEADLDNQNPLPRLKDIYKLNNTSFDRILEFHTDVLFKKFPPYYMVFDYTNERTFTDMMIRDYGEDRVEKINFSSGISGTKKILKDDGLSILKQGYKFPNPTRIRDPAKSKLVKELVEELQHEEMKLTPTGRESFDHPTNRHNDLAIAWELSIHGCLKFMLNAISEPVAYSAGRNESHPYSEYGIDHEELIKEDLAHLKGVKLNDVSVQY